MRHARPLFAVLSAPELYDYLDEPPPESEAALARRYQRLESRQSPDGEESWLNWVIAIRETGELVGYVQATVRGSSAHVAYVLARSHWGRGLASEATAAMIEALRAQLAVTTFRASVDARNARSLQLLARLGFARRAPSAEEASRDIELQLTP